MSGRFAWTIGPHPISGEAAGDVDPDYVRRSVTDLVTLIMLYRMTAETEAEELP